MAADWNQFLERWTEAGLVEPGQAQQIRVWEALQAPRPGLRWPVIIAVFFGGMMLAAGVLLFVAAHWDKLSPLQRIALVVMLVAGFHLAGGRLEQRFHQLSLIMHGLGTTALGAGIALMGQIFNLEEHWTGGALLWATGSWIAWWLLRDSIQLTFAALLTPAWISGELIDLAGPRLTGSTVGLFVFLTALTYLTARRHDSEAGPRRVISSIGTAAFVPAAIYMVLMAQLRDLEDQPFSVNEALVWMIATLPPIALAMLTRAQADWMNGVAIVMAVAIVAAARAGQEILMYALCALASVGLVAWGVVESRKERINLGMISFGISVAGFYFSKVMDRLDRSLSLIVLGVLFLAGGWYLEQWRRKLIARVGS